MTDNPSKVNDYRNQDNTVLAQQTYAALYALYGEAECTLDGYEDPWRLLVGGILAAQCTDARVNLITPALFAAYPDVEAFANADPSEIEPLIRSCGLFRMKARSIRDSARALVEHYGGAVPDRMEDLLSLPGIGRKIANLVLGDGFGIPGMVVDTHCARVARRIGLTDSKDPVRIEKDLTAVFPSEQWIDLGHMMVAHGRALCDARNPLCGQCPLAGFCRYAANASV